ncbi:hypothetical protein [Pseudoxanthomonas sacheonensis]|uniref:hypothetical protein n=1 Tax=Pseudoxanthomonas sacheonensis TaxID=443615 RepID=UPI0013D4C9CB|nr:hypothetical protein [Pseudoxanthomonas sacheonensis]
MNKSKFHRCDALGFAPFEKGGGRPRSGRRGICFSREEQIPHKPLSRLVAPFFKGGCSGRLPVQMIGTVH